MLTRPHAEENDIDRGRLPKRFRYPALGYPTRELVMRNRMSALVWLAAALPSAAADAAALDAVNALRSAAGLPTLTHAPVLSAAAARHAAYLDVHRTPGAAPAGVSAHRQDSDSSLFSGATPADRAVAAGYPHRLVLENVSMGYDSLDASVDGLMRAIYHRLTFLDLASDELGSAAGERSRVFLLGRRDLQAVCAQPPGDALMQTPVDCAGEPMTREAYRRLCASLPADALFRPAHPVSCPNGRRLDARFMAQVCDDPPVAARLGATGRHYLPCPGRRIPIDATWFDALCERPPPAARARGSGRYVEMCEPPRRVAFEWFADFCAAMPSSDRYTDSGRYHRPCAVPHELRVEFLEDLVAARLQELPEFVIWPPADARDVAPAFFVEEPDPLPDLEVSGNPVSLQVNPAAASQVELTTFALYRVDADGRQPVGVRLLDAESDPNALLTAHEFALFPLQRLAWGGQYLAVAELRLDGRPRRIEWRFATRSSDARVLAVRAERARFRVGSGEAVWLYLPPWPDQPHTVLRSRISYPRGTRVDLSVIDPNTAEITIETRGCGPVSVSFDDGRVVDLLPQGCPGGVP
jgi:hypothetical protein